MTDDARQREDLISRYIDQSMEESERAAFEQRLASDEALRTELAVQSHIDASLKRLFGEAPTIAAPPPPESAAAPEKGPAALKPARSRSWRIAAGSLAAAALIAVAALVGWQTGLLAPAGPAARLYALKKADDFSFVWACETDEQFIEHTTETFGQPLVVDTTPAARIVGWAYIPQPWDAAIGLLVAKVEDRNVLVLIEPPTAEAPVSPNPGRGLHVFSREIGDVTLHEITPLDHPGALDLFRIP